MIARIHDDGEPKVGSTISMARLSIHLGRGIAWICRQGNVVHLRGETWRAELSSRGTRTGWTLLSRSPPPMCIERTVQQDHAAAMK